MSKVIVFSIDGGIGKCIAATAVCRAISKNNPTDQLFGRCEATAVAVHDSGSTVAESCAGASMPAAAGTAAGLAGPSGSLAWNKPGC